MTGRGGITDKTLYLFVRELFIVKYSEFIKDLIG